MASIYDEVLSNSPIYQNFRVLCKDVGHRLFGSMGTAAAIEYTREFMIEYYFDTVYLQPVMVLNWKLGPVEILKITNSKKHDVIIFNALALGNSVRTGPRRIIAEIIELKGLDKIEEHKDKIRGKIVFFYGPMDPTLIETFTAYGATVSQRSSGAAQTGPYGAKFVIVRSMTQSLDDIPHAGSLRYKAGVKALPAMAKSTKDANLLSKFLKDQADLRIHMESYAMMLLETQPFNVIGQLNGTLLPNE